MDTGYSSINEPDEAELGTLWFLASRKEINVTNKDYGLLEKYYQARNKLAHIKPIEYELLIDIT